MEELIQTYKLPGSKERVDQRKAEKTLTRGNRPLETTHGLDLEGLEGLLDPCSESAESPDVFLTSGLDHGGLDSPQGSSGSGLDMVQGLVQGDITTTQSPHRPPSQ